MFNVFRTKYTDAQRKEERFFTQNEEWVSVEVTSRKATASFKTPTKSGRTPTDFSSSSDRTKRRKTEAIRNDYDCDTISYAAQMKLRSAGKSEAAKIVQDVTSIEGKASTYKEALRKSQVIPLTHDEALCFFLDNDLSKKTDQGIKTTSDKHNAKIYPSYHNVLKAKKRCYPSDDAMNIAESKAEVKLQNLLDHTASRITDVARENIGKLTEEFAKHLQLICKWGFDGTSGQSNYKMKFNDNTDSDSSLFYTSIVPLGLASLNEENDEKVVIWCNPRPSSTRFCQPL